MPATQPSAQNRLVPSLSSDRLMPGSSPDHAEDSPSSTVSITVLSIKPVKFGKIFALASVEIDIDGVVLVLHGVRAIRVQPLGTWIDLPMFRDENGTWRHAIALPDEICGPIGRAVLDELVERGLAARSPAPLTRGPFSQVCTETVQNLWALESNLARVVGGRGFNGEISLVSGNVRARYGSNLRQLRVGRTICCSAQSDAPLGISSPSCA
jgi:stage V sporulation protein G